MKLSDLHNQLDRLENSIRNAGTDTLPHEPPHLFQSAMTEIVVALREVVQASKAAIDPHIQEEAAQAIAADAYRRSHKLDPVEQAYRRTSTVSPFDGRSPRAGEA